MSDEKTNLEPTENSENNLAKKFGHVEKADFENQGEQTEERFEKSQERDLEKETASAEKDHAYGEILSKVKSKEGSDYGSEDISKDAKEASLQADADSQVQHLVDLAVDKDVAHAVKVAKHLEDNYVLDAFHSRLLSKELHGALDEKGLLE
jgi:hypothetical protein